MIASRLWYLILGLALGFATFVLFVGSSMFDRASKRTMSEGLGGDAQVVSWYMKDDARRRSSALINFALDGELVSALSKSSVSDKVPQESKDKAKKALKAVSDKLPPELQFTALFAIDQYGRVIAQIGYDQAIGIEDFELGGYPVVADALHGWVRDDAWVLDGRIWRVVARPVEGDTTQAPAGAIVGTRILDDTYARELSKRTGAAVAFYAGGTRVASAAPEGFDAAQLDAITADLSALATDPSYKEKGRSEPRILRDDLGVVYTRIPGESWDLGAGFAVGRQAFLVGSPLGFLQKGDDLDKKSVNLLVVGGIALLAALGGFLFSFLEHNRPIATFAKEAQRFAKAEVDQLAPSKFLGVFRRIASDVNDGVDKIAAKGGGTRKAADLESVLGPMPAQPSMSAFSFPGDAPSSPGVDISNMGGSAPRKVPQATPSDHGPPPPRNPHPPAEAPAAAAKAPPPPNKRPPPRRNAVDDEPDATVVSKVPQDLIDAAASGEVPAFGGSAEEDTSDWPRVFEDFLRVKRENGEATEGLTFEKFQSTLRKNREAIIARHACKHVKFTVYVKEGRAALKASPVKDLASRLGVRPSTGAGWQGRRPMFGPHSGERSTMLARRTIATASLGLGIAGAMLSTTGTARANGFELQSNGTEQLGRGSAWLARASDPLAVYYNPAALSRNGSGVSVTANIWFQQTCFTREGPPGTLAVTSGDKFYDLPKVCNSGKAFPNPQLAFQYRVSDKLGIGIAVMGPSADGKSDFSPTSTGSPHYGNTVGSTPRLSPSGTRYMLTTLDATIIWPQFAVGYEVADRFRIGASLIWGMAFLKFGNYTAGTNGQDEKFSTAGQITGGGQVLNGSGSQDVAAVVTAHDYFIPGIVLSALYTPIDNIDVAAWFHWSDAVKATGSADVTGIMFDAKGLPSDPSTQSTVHVPTATVNVPQPWEMKLGVRYYMPRHGVSLTQKGGLLKDPLRDEVFDVEIDAEYDHDSSFQTFGLNLAQVPLSFQGIPGNTPSNGDIPHVWKDSYGIRAGGEYNILPGQLAVRAGGNFQTASMQAQYAYIDFVPLQRIGVTGGATYRIGPIDIQAGYGHVFFKTLDNGGVGAIYGLTGSNLPSASNPVASRTQYPINGGKVTSTADVISIGVVYRFGQDEVVPDAAPPAPSGGAATPAAAPPDAPAAPAAPAPAAAP